MQQTFTRAQVIQLLGNALADSLQRLNNLEEKIRKHGDLAREVAHLAAQRDTVAAEGMSVVKSSDATVQATKVQDNVASLHYALEVERTMLLSRSSGYIKQIQYQYNQGLITLSEYVNATSWDAIIREQVVSQLATFEALMPRDVAK